MHILIRTPRSDAQRPPLILIQVFLGNVVLREFAGANFALVGIVGLLNSLDNARFERVPFIDQLTDAFRIDGLGLREALRIGIGDRLFRSRPRSGRCA